MALGFGVLRHSSRDFWSMTPRELAAAIEGRFGAKSEPAGRAALAALMSAFPDQRG